MVRRLIALAAALGVVGVGAGLWLSSGPPVPSTPISAPRRTPNMTALSCKESAGQQGRDNERLVGGVAGLLLPDSRDPAGLTRIHGADGRSYFVYKAFLAVSSTDAPYATVSIVRPRSAKLYYALVRPVDREFRGWSACVGFKKHGSAASLRTALHRVRRWRCGHRADVGDLCHLLPPPRNRPGQGPYRHRLKASSQRGNRQHLPLPNRTHVRYTWRACRTSRQRRSSGWRRSRGDAATRDSGESQARHVSAASCDRDYSRSLSTPRSTT